MDLLKITDKAPRSNNSSTNKPGFMSTNKRLCRPALPEMPDDLIPEILVRLPVKSLLRFKSVCRTWHATISGGSFISTHLRRSMSDHQRRPSFLICPDMRTKGSSKFRLYKWQKGQDSASLVYTLDFQGDIVRVYELGHCNGLVLVRTNANMYVLNPSTRELLTLPESSRSVLSPYSAIVGLGLDPCTNKYKVVRSFSYASDLSPMGVEICEIDETGRAWRHLAVDPPYPIAAGDWQTATFFQGSLFWILHELIGLEAPESRLLRFCLKDEIFSFTMHPPCPALGDGDEIVLNELDGELCLTQFDSSKRMVIWMTKDAVNPHWDRRYVLDTEPSLIIGISHRGLLLLDRYRFFQYDFRSQKTEDVADLDDLEFDGPGSCTVKYVRRCPTFIDVVPCIESLVPIARAI